MTAEQDYHDAIYAAAAEFHATMDPVIAARLEARSAVAGAINPKALEADPLPPEVTAALIVTRMQYRETFAAAQQKHDLAVLAAIAARDEAEGSDEWRQPDLSALAGVDLRLPAPPPDGVASV